MIFDGVEYPYEITDREIHKIGRVTVVKDTIRIDGIEYPYTFTKTRDGVCIFPVCDDGVIAIKQYRHSINAWVYEVPAGAVDEGESNENAAKRELLEETGFVVDEIIDLGRYCENEGVSSSFCQLFFARCSKKVEPKREKTELIELEIIPFDRFEKMINNNEFKLLIGMVAWYKVNNLNLL